MINPIALKKGNDVRNYLRKHPLDCKEKSVDIVKAEDGSGVIVVMEFLFPDIKQAEIFTKMYELAEEVDPPMERNHGNTT